MTTMEIGKELVALCKQGKNQEAIDRLYSPNIECRTRRDARYGTDPERDCENQRQESMVDG